VITCIDVDYHDVSATVALVGFTAWPDEIAALEIVHRSSRPPAAYEPGKFYEREMPYVLGILARVTEPLDAVIVDSYAWLGPDRPGLGARLHDIIHAPVIGVAKTSFKGASSIEVTRGASANPMFVTAAGIDAAVAADHIRAMHGPFRIPSLLKRCDALCRDR
jgi:deoxyribonuclease V